MERFGDKADTRIPLIDLENTEREEDVIQTARDRANTLIPEEGVDFDSSLRSIVHQHARDGDAKAIKELIEKNPHIVNARDDENITALHYAARYGNYDVVKLLLENGADANSSSKEMFTPLHFAARYYKREVLTARGDECLVDPTNPVDSANMSISFDPTYKIINLLVDNEAIVDAKDSYELCPLHYAAIRDVAIAARALVGRKCAIDPQDKYKMTPLMTACVYGSNEVVRILLDAKADYTICDMRQNTVLHIAAQHGRLDTLDLFLKLVPDVTNCFPKRRPSYSNVDDKISLISVLSITPTTIINEVLFIQQHCEEEELEMKLEMKKGEKEGDAAAEVLRRVNSEGRTPLQLAAEGAHTEVVGKMLALIAGPDEKVDKWTSGELLLPHFAAAKGYLDILKELVKYGASLRTEDSDMRLPIHHAAENNHKQVVEYLLELEPNSLEETDSMGMTPLLLTAAQECLDVAKVLFENKANLQATDKQGRTAVFLAAKYNKTTYIQWFLDEISKRHPPITLSRMKSLRVPMSTSLNRGACSELVNRPDMDQMTAMHYAAANGYLEACEILYQHGARIDALDEDEQTPLHVACMFGRNGVVRQLIEWDRRLPIFKDDGGNTPLHLAAKNGHNLVCEVLLKVDNVLTAKNVYEELPLDLAVKGGHIQTVRVLVEHGAALNGDQYTGTTPLYIAAECGHDKVVEYLLQRGADISKKNAEGKTALDIALEHDNEEVTRALLSANGWESLLRTSNTIPTGKYLVPKETPFRKVIAKFPDLAKLVMDKCITKEGRPDDINYAVRYNFEFLDDTYMIPTKDGTFTAELSAYDEDGKLLSAAKPYAVNYDKIYKSHPLKCMVKSKHMGLLAHPLVLNLLKYKWNHLGRYVYYTALSVYILFLTCYTIFLAETPAPFNVFNELTNETVDLSEVLFHSGATCDGVVVQRSRYVLILRMMVMVLSIAQLLKELFQLCTRKVSYYLMSLQNWVEVSVYLVALLTVMDFSPCSVRTGLRLDIQWLAAIVTTFAAWLNLLFLIQKLPRFGIYILMFFDVSKTFLRFAVIFVLFITAFSITFFLMLQNRPEFSSIPLSVMKTTVMTIGEMEFNGIFHGDYEQHSEKLFSKYAAYPVFFVFSVVMTIILMNLLVGLAVDDIKSVAEKAELKRLSMQVDLVLQVETSIPTFIRRVVATNAYSIFPNRKSKWKNFRNWFGQKQADSLSEEMEMMTLEEEKNSDMKRELLIQRDLINNLQANVDYLYEKQARFEGMLLAIMKKLDVKEVEE